MEKIETNYQFFVGTFGQNTGSLYPYRQEGGFAK